MANQKMLISATEDETRIALVENNKLVDLHMEQTSRERTLGNIYRGSVVKVNPAFQAAFIEYGESRNGFLSLSDLTPDVSRPDGKSRPRIQSLLKKGQPLMLQVIKERIGHKGAALTTNVSLPGRYMVLSPYAEKSGVSRRIEDVEERSRLKEIISGLSGEHEAGIIIRTAGVGRSLQELKRDVDELRRTWKSIETAFKKGQGPVLLHREVSTIERVLRDYYNADVEEVWVDSAEAYHEALVYFKSTLPRFQRRLKLYVGDQSLFSSQHVEEQIAELDSTGVSLRSGGAIVIEPTEAMVSIDVNSGRSNQESDIEETALRTNLEAAEEVARQLRLRNLGGLIVVDFIDMYQEKNRKRVAQVLTDNLARDKARTTVGSISQFGLLELSRQRIDMELSQGLRVHCPNCSGTGSVPTSNASANLVLRKIREMAATGSFSEIHGELTLDSANHLLNHKREQLRDLELEFDLHVHLFGNPALPGAHQVHLAGTPLESAADEEALAEAGLDSEEAPVATQEAGDRPRRRRRRGGRARDGEGQETPAEETAVVSAADEEEEEEERDVPPWGIEPEEEEDLPRVGTETPFAEFVPVDDDAPPPRAGFSPRESAPVAARPPARPAAQTPDLKTPAMKETGETAFTSVHRPADTQGEVVLIQRGKRSEPFAALAGDAGQLLYDSSRALAQAAAPAADDGEATGDETPAASAPKARRRRKSGSSKTAGKAPAEQDSGDGNGIDHEVVAAQPADGEADGASAEDNRGNSQPRRRPSKNGNVKVAAAPAPEGEDSPRPSARRRSGRRRSAGARRSPQAASA